MSKVDDLMRAVFGPGFVKPGHGLDESHQRRIAEVLQGTNVVQVVLHAHMLIERTVTAQIKRKLMKPKLLDNARLSFSQKISLFTAMYSLQEGTEKNLLQFNRLRNKIAHGIGDENKAVFECFPRTGKLQLDAAAQARMQGVALLLVLGGIAFKDEDGGWITVDPDTACGADGNSN